MSDPYKGDAGLVCVTDPESPKSMRLRVTVDHDAGMSYVAFPVQEESWAVTNEHLPGPYAVNLDRTPKGEVAGIEIEGVITDVDFIDITEGEP